MNIFMVFAFVLFVIAAFTYIPFRAWGDTDFRLGIIAAGLACLTLGLSGGHF